MAESPSKEPYLDQALERVRKEKGAKKVMLRNLIEAKFKTILKPIATTLMKKKQLPLLSQAVFLKIHF